MESYNSLPNLQLLQATQNIEKSDKPFSEWLELSYQSQADRNSFLMQHHINTDESLALEDFLSFITARRKALKSQFMNMLNVKPMQANDTSNESGEA